MTKRKKSVLIWSLAIIGYYCWFQTFYNAVRFGTMFPYNDINDLLAGVIKNFIPNLVLSLSNLFIVFRFTISLSLHKKIIVDLLLSVVFTFGIGVVYLTVEFYLGQISHIEFSKMDWVGIFLNDITIFMCMELVYYFTKLLRSLKETEEARNLALQYQYDALKAQVNPHFLFNSLNLLCSIVSVDSGKAEYFIHELARMYRYIMAQQNREIVKLKKELEFLGSYVSVLKMRYNNKFQVIIEGTAEDDMYVVPFTMQLLIENVTKHNIISSALPMEVTIRISKTDIIVSNPIRQRFADSIGKVGLRYLTQLYAIKGNRFYIVNDGAVFSAHVPVITESKL
ncbi:MAG: histidine kinase [Bacteroides sp.]|nr:histidine kinase [Bacteroides sp.]